jgi:hypothetical protein
MLLCLLVGGVKNQDTSTQKQTRSADDDGVCALFELWKTMEMLTTVVDVPGETNGRLGYLLLQCVYCTYGKNDFDSRCVVVMDWII